MERNVGISKIAELIKKGKICSFTTISEQGSLASRPMALQQIEFDGELWFFTKSTSNKCAEIALNPQVNIMFNAGDDWVSLSGTASQVDNLVKQKELWNPFFKAWFPEGFDDPELTLIKVDAESAEYWDSANRLTQLIGMAKSAITGKSSDIGDNRTVTFD